MTSLLKNLGHWLDLQTVTKNILVTAEVLPLKDIVLSAFHKGSPDLLLTISFAGQLLTAGSGSCMFQSYHPWLHDILSLLAELHASPCLTLHCVLEVEILFFNSLSLALSDFQEEVNVNAVNFCATCGISIYFKRFEIH